MKKKRLAGPTRALAMEGGGWKAFAVHTGLVSGLLSALGREAGAPATLEGSGLLGNFSLYSSNSGGTWFSSSLLYSEPFLRMIEAMGASPFHAGEIYNREYTAKLLSLEAAAEKYRSGAGVFNDTKALCEDMAHKLSRTLDVLEPFLPELNASDITGTSVPVGQLLRQVLSIAGYGNGYTWPMFVLNMLQQTANIRAGVSLGGAVNAFALGKTWLAASSIPAPGSNLSWAPSLDNAAYLSKPSLLNRNKFINYKAVSPNASQFPSYLPAKYSIVLGAGDGSSAPFPFCADEHCFGVHFDYTLSTLFSSRAASSPPLGEAYGSAFGASAGRLPLFEVASASSSFLGGIVVKPALAPAYGKCLDLTTWATSAADGEAFRVAQEVVTPNIADAYSDEAAFRKVAAGTTIALVDGGYTDNTGVAHAVAAGATEVVVFLQWYDVINLFSPSNLLYGENMATYQVHFRVFAERAGHVREQFMGRDSPTGRAFQSLEVPPGNGTFLIGLSFGTIRATTVDCPWFGVRGGTPVTIHAFWPDITLSMGGTEDWYDYGVAVNEITSTMIYEPNRALTKEMLSAVLGASPDQA